MCRKLGICCISVIIIGFVGCATSTVTPAIQLQNIVGSGCKITEPIYNTTFDLTQLHSEMGHKINGDADDIIEFNVCGGLKKTCAGSDAAAACFKKNNTEHRIGTSLDTEPILTNGRIYFNFTGDICNKKLNESYNLQIILMCDYSSHIAKPLTLMPYWNDKCKIIILWKTRLACHPLSPTLDSNVCTTKDPHTGHIFNLMPLSRFNHKVLHENGSEFLINICKPVLYGFDEMCPPGSSICMVKMNEPDVTKKFINYGSTVVDPIFENNNLLMRFSSNATCNATHKIHSTINFLCDPNVPLGEPEFLGERSCEYRFEWVTSLACNTIQSCRTIDPITGHVYDLSSLSGKKYQIDHESKTYAFGICTAPREPCIENAGACQTTNGQSSSFGIINDNLQMNKDGTTLFLLYDSGSVCESLHKQWNTRIEFVCQTDGNSAGPKIVENTNCTLIIHFVTRSACQSTIECKAYDYIKGQEIDLTPLISTKTNYLAAINRTKTFEQPPQVLYYINVCRPLVPQYGLSCAGNSAACRAINGTITPEKEQSLGYADISLTMVNTPHGLRPQLKYLRGSTCPASPLTQLSTEIEFYCDVKAGKGIPILQGVLDDCHYVFNWPTNVICPTHVCLFSEQTCEIYNDHLEKALDLRTLFKDGIINVNYRNTSLDINICKNNRKIETDYAQSTVKVYFDAKGPCGSDAIINVEMRLVCKDTESQSFSSDTQSCGFVYIKETPLICPQLAIVPDKSTKPSVTNVIDTTSDNVSHKYSISFLGAAMIATIFVCSILAVVYLREPERRNRIMSLFRKRSVAVQYTRVRSNEEANLLIPQPGSLSDSDDDLLI